MENGKWKIKAGDWLRIRACLNGLGDFVFLLVMDYYLVEYASDGVDC
jgi:hypothetical protein